MFAFILEEKNYMQAMSLSEDTTCLVNLLQAKMVRITNFGSLFLKFYLQLLDEQH